MAGLENSEGSEQGITREDLLAYISGKCDDPELRAQIAREAERDGSFVQRWMAEMARRANDPLGPIDWESVLPKTEEQGKDRLDSEDRHGDDNEG